MKNIDPLYSDSFFDFIFKNYQDSYQTSNYFNAPQTSHLERWKFFRTKLQRDKGRGDNDWKRFLRIVNNHLIFRRVNCKRLGMQITQITVNIHISVFGRTIQLKRTSTTSYSVHWLPCKMQVSVNRNQSGVTLRPVFESAPSWIALNRILSASPPPLIENPPTSSVSVPATEDFRANRVNVLHFNSPPPPLGSIAPRSDPANFIRITRLIFASV